MAARYIMQSLQKQWKVSMGCLSFNLKTPGVIVVLSTCEILKLNYK